MHAFRRIHLLLLRNDSCDSGRSRIIKRNIYISYRERVAYYCRQTSYTTVPTGNRGAGQGRSRECLFTRRRRTPIWIIHSRRHTTNLFYIDRFFYRVHERFTPRFACRLPYNTYLSTRVFLLCAGGLGGRSGFCFQLLTACCSTKRSATFGMLAVFFTVFTVTVQ